MLLYCAICPPAAALLYLAFLPMWEGRPLLALGSAALPVAAAASISCVIIIVELVAALMSASAHVTNVIYTVEAYLEITVPAAFVVSVPRRRFTRARIADLLLRLRGPERVSSVTDALRDVLEDPALEVIGEAPGPRPEDAGCAPARPADGGRLRLRVTASSGAELASWPGCAARRRASSEADPGRGVERKSGSCWDCRLDYDCPFAQSAQAGRNPGVRPYGGNSYDHQDLRQERGRRARGRRPRGGDRLLE